MRPLVIGIVVATALIGSAVGMQGRTPVRPTKPITLMLDVGSVATTDDKLQLVVLVQSATRGLDVRVGLKDKSFMGGTLLVSETDISVAGIGLNSAADACDAGKTYDHVIADLTIKTMASENSWFVVLNQKREAFSFSSSQILLDADNARTLSTLLVRAQGNIEWLRPRIAGLDLSKPDPSVEGR